MDVFNSISGYVYTRVNYTLYNEERGCTYEKKRSK